MGLKRTGLCILLMSTWQYWYLDTPLPDDIGDPWKVKIIDASMRTYGHVMSVLGSLGFIQRFSDMDRWMSDKFIILATTGVPWVKTDPALKITEEKLTHAWMRIYEPRTSLKKDKRPVLIYFHGGGFSLLSVDSHDAMTRKIARDSGIVVISVNYRLSPQHPYPAPLDDATEAVEHVLRHSSRMGIDPNRVAVGGDSAGGTLAAAVSLRLKEKIRLQLLLVPVLQCLTYNTTSVIENSPYFSKTLNSLMLVISWLNYLGLPWSYLPDFISMNHTSAAMKVSKYSEYVSQETWMVKRHVRTESLRENLKQQTNYGRDDIPKEIIEKITNPFALPLMADKNLLKGLPRAYIMTAGYDLIRDEGIMYSERLREAGVATQLENIAEAFHNALQFVEGPLSLKIAGQIVHNIVIYLETHL